MSSFATNVSPRGFSKSGLSSRLRFLGGAVGVAVLDGFLAFSGRLAFAVVLAILPLVAWLLTRPFVLLVLLGASLPALMSAQAGGLHVAASDLLIAMAAVAIFVDQTVHGSDRVVSALAPLRMVVVPYSVFVLALLAFHPGVREVAQTLQRYELYLFPLAIGSFAAIRGWWLPVLRAYIIASTALTIVWPFTQFGLQKNPVGQLFTNAILLIVAIPSLRRLMPCLLLLVPGLLYTESRGAIGAAMVGVAVIAVFNARSDAGRVGTRVALLAVLAVAAFALMPASLRSRVTTFTPGTNTPAAYSLHIRQGFSRDAKSIIRAHPIVGVGVGNYAVADSHSSLPSDDPHEVLLLQGAEGGYGLIAAFVLLVLGSVGVLFRHRREGPLVLAAAAVVLATAVHGLVDVYWVRGTPVLSWLLVGMAMGHVATLRRREQAHAA